MKEAVNLGAAAARTAVALEGSVDEGVQSAPVDVAHDTRLKKIWVYTDNVFVPQSAADHRIVRVKTPAFDVSGWVDFTHARGQDTFEVETRVTMAHASDVHFITAAFEGGVLASMSQITVGMTSLSGNVIDFIIRQTSSADNFATKVPVAYQFVVESR